jgi:hypothetical protein
MPVFWSVLNYCVPLVAKNLTFIFPVQILQVGEVPWRSEKRASLISFQGVMLVHIQLEFTEDCVCWTCNVCGLNDRL